MSRRDTVAPTRKRSTLPRDEARRRYVKIGERVVLEQVRTDARRFDQESIAVGPFARLDAGAVAALEGKTRGAVTNLFGSQSAFQAETMALALNTWEFIERIEYPDPASFAAADEWVDAFFAGESARGPTHRAEPEVTYASLWTLWLSTVPYGLWSERASAPGIEEQLQHLQRLEAVLADAFEHFGLQLREGTTLRDLASAIASLVEGAWLNQCLTRTHPSDPTQPIAELLRRSGRLLWAGAVVPR
jgi:AcrR family transcriptional regulator